MIYNCNTDQNSSVRLYFPGKIMSTKLPMGMCNIPEILKEKTSELFEGFDTVHGYIDKVIVMIKK